MAYGWLRRLFVELCPACGGPSPAGFCSPCAAEFSRVVNACGRCGLARPVARCPSEQGPWDVDAMIAPLSYERPLDHYVRALKYSKARHLGRALALLVATDVAAACSDVDGIVAVPLHTTRLRERGYNQAQEIARTLGGVLGLATLVRGIGRRAPAASQTGLGLLERQTSVARAFRVDRDLAGRRLAIVDDVVTTGATVNALARALKAAGAASCTAVAVARTPEPAQPRKM